MVERDSNGAIDEMTRLRRLHHHVHVLVRDILEQHLQVDFLLVIPTERRARLLSDYRNDRLVIQLRVVETVQ